MNFLISNVDLSRSQLTNLFAVSDVSPCPTNIILKEDCSTFVFSGMSNQIVSIGNNQHYAWDGQFTIGGRFYHPQVTPGELVSAGDIRRNIAGFASDVPVGVFCNIEFSSENGGSFVLVTDQFGFYPVFMWLSKGRYVISNCICWIELCVGSLDRSSMNAAENLLCGGPFSATQLTGVVRLRPNAFVKGGGGIHIEPARKTELGHYEEHIDAALESSRKHLGAVFSQCGKRCSFVSDITGGLDSRLVLGMLTGSPEWMAAISGRCLAQFPNPDSNVAGMLIEKFGIPIASYPSVAVDAEKELRESAFFSGGGSSPTLHVKPVCISNLIHLRGSYGEIGGATPGLDYGVYLENKGGYSFGKHVDLLLRRRQNVGAVDYLTSECKLFIAGEYESFLRMMAEEHGKAQVVAESYLLVRARSHFGMSSFAGNRSRVLPDPLANAHLVNARRLLSPSVYSKNKVIFDLIIKAGGRDLAFLPVAGKKWDRGIVPDQFHELWKNMESIDRSSSNLSSINGPLVRNVKVPGYSNEYSERIFAPRRTCKQPDRVFHDRIGLYQAALEYFLGNLDAQNEIWRIWNREKVSEIVRRDPMDFRADGVDVVSMGIVSASLIWVNGLELKSRIKNVIKF